MSQRLKLVLQEVPEARPWASCLGLCNHSDRSAFPAKGLKELGLAPNSPGSFISSYPLLGLGEDFSG